MNYQWVAEVRAERKYDNLTVLNSYKLAKDGKHYFFEVILVDPSRPEIFKDKNLKWTVRKENQKRSQKGFTSAAHKARVL
mgnify:CR=1 FL=1